MHQAPKSNQDTLDLSTNLTANDPVTDSCLPLPCAIGHKRQTFPSKDISSSILNKFYRGMINNPCLWEQNQGRTCRIIRQVGLCVMTLILGIPAYAQVTTDGTLPTPTGVDHVGNTWNISGGTRPGGGPTLYHSFNQFSVATGDTAMFVNDSATPVTNNILGRVTGGSISDIQGTIDSATNFPGANLFLMNPAGFIFGSGATLNVGGTFTATTANNIQSADQGIFNASLNEPNVLVSAAPEAFGFLNQAPPVMVAGSNAAIEIKGLNGQGGDILLVGRDASVNGTLVPGVEVNGTLNSPGGNVTLASVDSPGNAVLGSLNLDGFPRQGQVILANGTAIQTDGPTFSNAGDVTVYGREIQVTGASITAVAGALGGRGGGIALKATESLTIEQNSNISVPSGLRGAGAGSVALQADDEISITNSTIQGRNILSSNAGGKIFLGPLTTEGSPSITLQSGIITTQSFGTGAFPFVGLTGGSGDIEIQGRDVSINQFSVTTNTAGAGNAGSVDITATESFTIISGDTLGTLGIVSSGTTGAGNAGPITITTGSGSFQHGGFVQSTAGSTSTGHAGVISYTATQDTVISGKSAAGTTSGLSTNTNGAGNGNVLTLNVTSFSLLNGGSLRSEGAEGNGGAINLSGTDILVSGPDTEISTKTSGAGTGGNVNLTASNSITFTDGATATAQASGTGDAGSLSFTGNTATLTNSTLTTSTAGAGHAGALTLNVGSLTGSAATLSSSSTGAATGNAGSILVHGRGGAGTLPTEVNLTNSTVSTTAEGTGAGGVITMGASGTSPFSLSNTTISASVHDIPAGGAPDAGLANITLGSSGTLTISGGRLIAETTGARNAGTITLNAGTLTATGTSISSSSTGAATGNAGDLSFTSTGGSLSFTNSTLTTSAPNANGGNQKFTATNPLAQIFFNNTTVSASVGGGTGGNINVDPGFIIMKGSNMFGTATSGQGGNISLTAGEGIFVDTFSTLDVRSQTGDPTLNGSINVQAPYQQLKGAIQPLPHTTVKAANLYSQGCAAQKDGQFSSLVQAAVGGIPPAPGGFLPSPALLIGTSVPTIGTSEMFRKVNAKDLALEEMTEPIDLAIHTPMFNWQGTRGCAG